MNEKELESVMFECGFSDKQIILLRKLSQKYSTPLLDTVTELSRRFPISLGIHIGMFFIIFFTYLRDIQSPSYNSGYLIVYVITLLFAYVILNLFAPLIRGYKARKVIRKIKKGDASN
ncbi:hypothetical protein GYD59_004568 [Salmonella enterica]|nr:hypothetical protein [Salmonella enterica]EEH2569737.1 hypothetical protein [Salmonella enterica]